MKKFIYILNIFLFVLIPTTVFVGGGDINTHYETDTISSIKMIKTTVLLDRSNKKQEEKELEEKKRQEEEEKRRLEEQEKENAAKKLAAITKPVKVNAEVGSLASSNGASDATNNSNVSSDSSNVGSSTTVTFKPSEMVYVGAELTGSMSAYGTDCCSLDPEKQGHTSSGFNIKQNGMYYYDATYGKVRILAADDNFIFYSIIKVKDPIDGEYYAIILDSGDKNIGIGRKFMFDLVVESQDWASKYYGIHHNITFEVLRIGR